MFGRLFNIVLALIITYFTLTLAFPVPTPPHSKTWGRTEAKCYTSDPDVSGIGVRISTYIQSLILFFITGLCIRDGYIDSHERKVLEKGTISLLISCSALLITTVFQAITSQLSIYHAFRILDCSWTLTANALFLYILPILDGQPGHGWIKRIRSAWPSRSGQLFSLFFLAIQLSLTAAVGLYVWLDPASLVGPNTTSEPITRPDANKCFQETFAHTFLFQFRAPGLRIASFVWYSMIAIPVLNVFLLTGFALVIINLTNDIISFSYDSHHFFRLYGITWLALMGMNIYSFFDTEDTIRHNKHLIDDGESSWGFGQFLAVVLILSPTLEALSMAVDGAFKRKVAYRLQRFLQKSEEGWQKAHERECTSISDVITHIRHNQNLRSDTRKAAERVLKSAKWFLDAADRAVYRSTPRQNTSAATSVSSMPRGGAVLPVHRIPQTENGRAGSSSMSPMQGPSSVPLLLTVVVASEHTFPPSAQSDDTITCKEELEHLWERISKMRELRFAEIRDAKTFFVVNEYLRAAKDAVGAASAALDADAFLPRNAASTVPPRAAVATARGQSRRRRTS